MNIRLKDIGIVKDASIELNGLTVITGKNKSGKTTVGKAIYSLIDAVSQLQLKYRRDRAHYIWMTLHELEDVMPTLRRYYLFTHFEDSDLQDRIPQLYLLLSNRIKSVNQLEKLESYTRDLILILPTFKMCSSPCSISIL